MTVNLIKRWRSFWTFRYRNSWRFVKSKQNELALCTFHGLSWVVKRLRTLNSGEFRKWWTAQGRFRASTRLIVVFAKHNFRGNSHETSRSLFSHLCLWCLQFLWSTTRLCAAWQTFNKFPHRRVSGFGLHLQGLCFMRNIRNNRHRLRFVACSRSHSTKSRS